jgi:hypothetical protein
LKERVFGCDLGEHLLNSGHESKFTRLHSAAPWCRQSAVFALHVRLWNVSANSASSSTQPPTCKTRLFACLVPPLWSSGQRSGFDSWHYQIF